MAETRFPLTTHASPDAVVAYDNGKPITQAHLLADANTVAATLTAKGHVLNTCQNRYHFAVGLAATLIAECISLMPAAITAETLTHLQDLAPDFVRLDDETIVARTAAINSTANHQQPHDTNPQIPLIEGSRLVAWVFTSGSTGNPLPHAKTWGSLVTNVRIEAQRLGMLDGRSHTIIGTVPPQHMYGFESTVLVAMQSACAFEASRPFYPADISNSIAATPRPRLLVTTPFHLHSLLASGITIPPIDLVVSATAPLTEHLAEDTESRLHTRILEIYGCTETGQVATRYPTRSDEWQLFDGVSLSERDGRAWAAGGHLDQPVPMQDSLTITQNGHFLLNGRNADMVNIAGKRSSLAYLNHQLSTVPGVTDGTFFIPDEDATAKITRLTAFVVAPELDTTRLTNALRERIDPAFLPRPIIFVDALPRNSTGKLPRAALLALAKPRTQLT